MNSTRKETIIRTDPKPYSLARGGVTTTELIVACIVLTVAMTFATTMCVRINRVWKDVTHQRIAMNELANQLESLTLSPASEIADKLSSLEISRNCQRALNSPVLSGTTTNDDLGVRVDLKIQWSRTPARHPVELSGWLVESDRRQSNLSNEGNRNE